MYTSLDHSVTTSPGGGGSGGGGGGGGGSGEVVRWCSGGGSINKIFHFGIIALSYIHRNLV